MSRSLSMILPEVSNPQASKESSSSVSRNQGTSLGDCIMLAYLYILQSVNNVQQTTQISAKQMQANAQAQASVNNREADIPYIHVPTYWIHYTKEKVAHEHKYYDPQAHTFFFTTYYTYQQVFKSDNADQVQIVMVKNNQNQKMRDDLTNELVVLRQDSQVQETKLNSDVDTTEQACQEGIGITKMLKTLFREVLLRN